MRFTIERIRTLVLVAAALLIVAIGAFLVMGKFKRSFIRRDLPKHLGIEIQQEANGVTYTQAHGGHTLFKLHASRVVQLRNQLATLHDVQIELYGRSASGGDTVMDRIKGGEFEYDQKSGIATAAGPVDITLTRPTEGQQLTLPGGKTPGGRTIVAPKPPAQLSPNSVIHVRTSGIVFNQQTGIVTTGQHVEFSTDQASGSSTGASYDSQRGFLVLDHDVALTAKPGNAANAVQLHAQYAEFDREKQTGRFRNVTAQTRGDQATAVEAEVYFREDGSVERLNAWSGFVLTTSTGSRLAAPTGRMEFTAKNQPSGGHLEGGVVMSSISAGRAVNGAAPVMDLQFAAGGVLRHVHLERGVEIKSHEEQEGKGTREQGNAVELTRIWHSPVADIDFRKLAHGGVEPAVLHGTGGVVITGETRRGSQPPVPSRMAADEFTGQFGPHATLLSMNGAGHASMEQTTAAGDLQTATGDRLQARFSPSAAAGPRSGSNPLENTGASQIESAVLDGDVTLVQQPARKPGAQPQPPMRARAGRAVYEGAGQWLHLTINPRVNQEEGAGNGGLEMTAERIDVSQQSGDAFAHGNVKATWIEPPATGHAGAGAASSAISLGGRGPAHVIAAEAQLHQPTGDATFRGHARLWQDENSISAPIIVLDRQRQTLVAKAGSSSEPVLAVLLTTGSANAQPGSGQSSRNSTPSVVRVRGGGLWYSGLDRRALFRAAPLAKVVAQSGAVESQSDQVELFLAPASAPHAGNAAASSQVDRMVAQGHVVLTSQGRRGTGQQLVYTSQTGEYVLTGSAAAPPRMTDPQQGNVTGEALIFHSRDDSVSIEGNGHRTVTQTTAPK